MNFGLSFTAKRINAGFGLRYALLQGRLLRSPREIEVKRRVENCGEMFRGGIKGRNAIRISGKRTNW